MDRFRLAKAPDFDQIWASADFNFRFGHLRHSPQAEVISAVPLNGRPMAGGSSRTEAFDAGCRGPVDRSLKQSSQSGFRHAEESKLTLVCPVAAERGAMLTSRSATAASIKHLTSSTVVLNEGHHYPHSANQVRALAAQPRLLQAKFSESTSFAFMPGLLRALVALGPKAIGNSAIGPPQSVGWS